MKTNETEVGKEYLDIESELIYMVGELDTTSGVSKKEIEEFKEDHIKAISGNYTKEQLELSIKEDEKLLSEFESDLKDYNALERLIENEDFLIFMNSYLKKEPSRISDMLIQAHAIDNNTENQLMNKLSGIRHFKLFIGALRSRAEDAVSEIQNKKINIETINVVIENKDFAKDDSKSKEKK